VFVAVVHTTPAGSKLNRQGEIVQVRDLFTYMGDSPDLWIAAGDFYLDPESPIEGLRSGNEGRDRLFQALLNQTGTKIVVSVSATNQSRLGNYGEALKDQVELIVEESGERKTIRVLNKRADFLVCNAPFQFMFGGMFSPAGSGLLLVDPNHNALNWWSAVSDHAPVGGILSTGLAESCQRYMLHQSSRPQDDKRLAQAYEELNQIRRNAVYALSCCTQQLIKYIGFKDAALEQWKSKAIDEVLDLDSMNKDVAKAEKQEYSEKKKEWERQGKIKGQEPLAPRGNTVDLKVPQDLWLKGVDLLVMYKQLVLVADQLLSDPELDRYNPQRTAFPVKKYEEAAEGLTCGWLAQWMRFWSSVPSAYVEEMGYDSQVAIEFSQQFLSSFQALNLDFGDIDLTPEAETYVESGKAMFQQQANF